MGLVGSARGGSDADGRSHELAPLIMSRTYVSDIGGICSRPLFNVSGSKRFKKIKNRQNDSKFAPP